MDNADFRDFLDPQDSFFDASLHGSEDERAVLVE
jgi:hypothetical protein